MSITPPPPYRPTAGRTSPASPGYAPQIQRTPAPGNPKAKSALVLAIVAPLLCGPLEFLALAWGVQALKIADQTGEGRGKAIAAIAISATYSVVFTLVVLAALASSGSGQ